MKLAKEEIITIKECELLLGKDWTKKCSCGVPRNLSNIELISSPNDEFGIWYNCNNCNCETSGIVLWNKTRRQEMKQ